MKKIFLAASFITCLILINLGVKTSSALEPPLLPPATGTNYYQAIVKVKTFVLDSAFYLTENSEGSGVIISPTGLLLTNYHVISETDAFDEKDIPVAIQICLTESTGEEPDCSYTASLIAKDKTQDIALLQIAAIPKLSTKTDFSFVNTITEDNTNIGDKITALGYPAIGGNTISITAGTISGKESKYDKQWIKTDAVVSYGSSGGAAIDEAGNLIGITSASHSDYLGSLGYIINYVSIKDWIDANKAKPAKPSELLSRLINFSLKQNAIKKDNKLFTKFPSFSILKPEGWEFEYNDEGNIKISDPKNEEGGFIAINFQPLPYFYSLDSIKKLLDGGIESSTEFSTISDMFLNSKKSSFNSYPALYATASRNGISLYFYLIPHENFLVSLGYVYGKDSLDKAQIDASLKTINLPDTSEYFKEVHSYLNLNPYFYLYTPADWVLIKMNSLDLPVSLVNKKISEINVDFNVLKLSTEEAKKSYEDILKEEIKDIKDSASYLADQNRTLEIISSSSKAKVNSKISNVIKIETVKKEKDTGKVLMYNLSYYFRLENKMVNIDVQFFSGDKAKYQKAVADLNKVLEKLVLVKPI